jgi:hypothetical protein
MGEGGAEGAEEKIMAFQCPSCGQTLTNRRRPKCGHCGASLPDSVRIPADKRSLLEGLRKEEEKQHKEFMERNAQSLNSHLDFPSSF